MDDPLRVAPSARRRRQVPASTLQPEAAPGPAVSQGARSTPPGRRLTAPGTVDDLLREAVSELRGRPSWVRL